MLRKGLIKENRSCPPRTAKCDPNLRENRDFSHWYLDSQQEIFGTHRLRVLCPCAAQEHFEPACPAAGLSLFQAVSGNKGESRNVRRGRTWRRIQHGVAQPVLSLEKWDKVPPTLLLPRLSPLSYLNHSWHSSSFSSSAPLPGYAPEKSESTVSSTVFGYLLSCLNGMHEMKLLLQPGSFSMCQDVQPLRRKKIYHRIREWEWHKRH